MMITTTDNPFNPINDYTNWYVWDCQQGYYTQDCLIQVAALNPDMSDAEEEAAIQQAIFTMLEDDVLGIYAVVG